MESKDDIDIDVLHLLWWIFFLSNKKKVTLSLHIDKIEVRNTCHKAFLLLREPCSRINLLTFSLFLLFCFHKFKESRITVLVDSNLIDNEADFINMPNKPNDRKHKNNVRNSAIALIHNFQNLAEGDNRMNQTPNTNKSVQNCDNFKCRINPFHTESGEKLIGLPKIISDVK